MLHELLVALSGISGSIFVDKKEQGFQVGKRCEFLRFLPEFERTFQGQMMHVLFHFLLTGFLCRLSVTCHFFTRVKLKY